MRHFDQRACKPSKVFFSFAKSQIKRVTDAVTVCMRKRRNDVKATDARRETFIDELSQFDNGFRVLRSERNSPSFWSEKKKEVMAMIRQLGCPTLFLTLSAAETHWIPLLKHLVKLTRNMEISDDEALNMEFSLKSELIRDNPVACVRYY